MSGEDWEWREGRLAVRTGASLTTYPAGTWIRWRLLPGTLHMVEVRLPNFEYLTTTLEVIDPLDREGL